MDSKALLSLNHLSVWYTKHPGVDRMRCGACGCMLVVMGRLEDIPADYEGRLGVPVFLKNLSNKNDLTEPPMPCAWR